jgi:hypothetical protein
MNLYANELYRSGPAIITTWLGSAGQVGPGRALPTTIAVKKMENKICEILANREPF